MATVKQSLANRCVMAHGVLREMPQRIYGSRSKKVARDHAVCYLQRRREQPRLPGQQEAQRYRQPQRPLGE